MRWSCSREGSQEGLARAQKTCPMRRGCSWRRDIFGMTEQQLSNSPVGAAKEMEPGSAQCHVLGEQEAMGTN